MTDKKEIELHCGSVTFKGEQVTKVRQLIQEAKKEERINVMEEYTHMLIDTDLSHEEIQEKLLKPTPRGEKAR